MPKTFTGCGKCGADADKHITCNADGESRCYECRTGKPLPDYEALYPRLQAQVNPPRMSPEQVADLVDAMYGPAR